MQYIFEERLGVEYSITNDKDEYFSNTNTFLVHYAGTDIKKGIFFNAAKILFEDDLKEIELHENIYNDVTVLFSHNDKAAALNFDVFAAVFYLLSRYEEYLGKPLDEHGNYLPANSVLYKLKIYDIPVVEQWIELLKDVLQKNFPEIRFKQHTAKFGLSFDVDVAFAYKNKTMLRTVGGIAKKLVTFNFNEAKNHVLTLLNRRRDIYDTYDYIFTSLQNKKPVFFFDMGDHGKLDKNPAYTNKPFRSLIKNIAGKARIGIHPSYTSNINTTLVAKEKKILEQITGDTITMSRQHYLKLKLPGTYNNLIRNHITEDFTQGYSSIYGFRAGTCNSFLFFDLIKNEPTTLRLYPFTYMEVTLNTYLKLSIEEAKKTVSKLINIIYRYDGIFIPLWHNSTLGNCFEWRGWREVFEHTLKEIDNKNMKNLFD
ncbi:MAG TPA: polysaccharide deacetylase family protein [Parafilimonas sp.]|nr:polysaccharide deacetylase family protein [Parafilimonas sp.]